MAHGQTREPLILDERLERAFADAAQRDHTTPTRALHELVEGYVRRSLREEALRQSRLVASASDSVETDALMRAVQDLDGV